MSHLHSGTSPTCLRTSGNFREHPSRNGKKHPWKLPPTKYNVPDRYISLVHTKPQNSNRCSSRPPYGKTKNYSCSTPCRFPYYDRPHIHLERGIHNAVSHKGIHKMVIVNQLMIRHFSLTEQVVLCHRLVLHRILPHLIATTCGDTPTIGEK